MMFEDDEDFLADAELYASDSRGIYIPQFFAESVHREYVTGVSEEDWAILESGPDHELYWDTWDMVLNNAVIMHPTKGKHYLWQDGDLWIVPVKESE